MKSLQPSGIFKAIILDTVITVKLGEKLVVLVFIIMMKQKFYDMMDKYLMAMGIDVGEFAELSELTLKSVAVQAALECQSMFDVAWDCEPCSEEDVRYVRSYTPDPDDPALADKLRILLEQREASLAAQA